LKRSPSPIVPAGEQRDGKSSTKLQSKTLFLHIFLSPVYAPSLSSNDYFAGILGVV
jgi:hypothetical protein